MSLNDKIKELTLSFFKAIGSDISEDHGLYDIHLSEKYHTYFESTRLLITFDRDVASKHSCHLIIPGSNILSRIITNCRQRGPISIQKSTSPSKPVIRYYFFVDFSGTSNISRLDHVDVVLKKDSDGEFLPTGKINPKDITASYLTALDELKKMHTVTREIFLNEANKKFRHDFKLFVRKYDVQIRELDNSINKKEETCDDPEEIKKFRFNTVEKIRDLEQEKTRLIDVLQEKHKVLLEYNLVACELISV